MATMLDEYSIDPWHDKDEETGMSGNKQLITIDASLWDAITRRAAAEDLSAEGWLQGKLFADGQRSQASEMTPDEALLDLAYRHFLSLDLEPGEQVALAEAMFRTLDSGEMTEPGPVGAQRRRYRFHRRVAALQIRIGEGAITLPLAYATRLATRLHGMAQPRIYGDIAA